MEKTDSFPVCTIGSNEFQRKQLFCNTSLDIESVMDHSDQIYFCKGQATCNIDLTRARGTVHFFIVDLARVRHVLIATQPSVLLL